MPADPSSPESSPPLPPDEQQRLETLRRYRVLDTPAEPAFDELAGLASHICSTPIALIALVDADRQFFKAALAVTPRQAPRTGSFCAQVILDGAPLVVPDVRLDPRVARDPIALADPEVRLYAGAPLVASDGHRVGALCVIDRAARSLTAEQVEALRMLASAVVTQLELRRSAFELAAQVDQQRRARKALAVSETRYRLLFEQHPQPMWVYDTATYRFLAVNHAAVSHYGYSRDEFARMTIVDLRPEGERGRFETHLGVELSRLPRLWRSGPWRHRRKGGDVIEVEIASYELEFDGRPARLVHVQDVTEQRAVERDSEESRRRLAKALEAADLGFWELDIPERRLYVDPRWVTKHDIHLDERGGLPFEAWVERIHPDDRDAARDMRERHLAGHTAYYESEYRVLAPGGLRWVQIRGSVVARDEQGRPLRVSGTLLDVTDRKQLEAQFLRAQRLESIGTLAGGIAHDLNNVLTPIMMATDLLRLQAQTDPQILATVQMIEESATRGADMIKQVLSFARGYEGSHVELQPAHVLREMSRIVRDTFPRTITVEATWPRDLWTVSADPTQIHQVLMNLCVNARDAMPGGGHLTLRADNVVLDEGATAQIPEARPGRYVMLTVADTGVGIPGSDRDRIFEPFYTTKEVGAGTGLGLSTALAIVRSHGGAIHLTSDAERGATFRVYLPARGEAGLVPGGSADTPIPRGHGELILVVDDEPSIRAVCRRTLEAFGYRVITATDGAEAIAVYAQQRGEVATVLLDMMMPIMDGPSTARALLRMNPQLRIIGGSGLAEESMAPRAAAAGVQHFLPKPYSTEGLLQTVARMLAGP